MAILAIIPARAGSKRIPKKNIKDFLGRPAIGYPIEASLNTGLFEKVVVSTDSEEIANIAISFGGQVPFLRSAETADDYATTAAVISEVLEKFRLQNQHFEWIFCIYPVATLISAMTINNAWECLKSSEFSSLATVVRYGHPIQRALEINGGKLQFLSPENRDIRTQEFLPRYHDAGQFYFCRTSDFLSQKSLMTNHCWPFELHDIECQDIDSPTDWALAEFKGRWKESTSPNLLK